MKCVVDPWTVEVVTPSSSLISKFSQWDKTKSSNSKRRSFNRARKWISDLLKIPFIIADNEKLRHFDIIMALEDMTNLLAMPGGITYQEYLQQCLAPLPESPILTNDTKNQDHDAIETKEAFENQNDECFQDAKDNLESGLESCSNHLLQSTHEENKLSKCKYCEENFAIESDLKNHVESIHEGKEPFKCTQCEESFATNIELKSHRRSLHNEKEPLQCNVCKEEFVLKSDLEHHLKSVHEGNKPFECNDCNDKFVVKSDLKSHIEQAHERKKICKSI